MPRRSHFAFNLNFCRYKVGPEEGIKEVDADIRSFMVGR
jgi:hypothetical protein